jgi:murein DD-endopeptidase MepM/ murein hydrolase activator NlpD
MAERASTPVRWLGLGRNLRPGLRFAFLALGLGTTWATATEPAGGGEFLLRQSAPCLSAEKRFEIQARIRLNTERLEAQGLLPRAGTAGPRGPQAHPLFIWPLRAAPGLGDFGYHGTSNFVDQDPAFPSQLEDYSCGRRTYDLGSGYNHRGTDYFLWPFGWRKMDRAEVQVVAAAPGTIVLRQDGNFDRSCGFSNADWNAVYVRHADGSVAWYGHMKKDSLTSKGMGAAVLAGEFLGVVGSSGSSTAPHLHFEVYDAQDRLVDPYQGACNQLNSDSWWSAQPPYFDSSINALATQTAPPVFPACPGAETPNRSDVFAPGDRVYFAAYYRDQRAGQQSDYTVLRPNGSTFAGWSHSFASPAHYAASYWYWYYTLPQSAPEGTWRFRVRFQGRDFEHRFFVGTPGAVGAASPWALSLLAAVLGLVAALHASQPRGSDAD